MRTEITTIALLLCFIIEVTSTGKFKLDLVEFTNTKGLLNDKSCCVGPAIDNTCSGQCNTYFKVCLKQFQRDITDGDCSFGEYVTDVIGNNSFVFPQHQNSFSNPLIFTIDYLWPGDFSLIIDVFHEPAASQAELITSLRGSSALTPKDGWVSPQWNSSNIESPQTLQFRYQIECDTNYYGDSCSKICMPRDDLLGHYECDENGDKVCRQGWRGDYCDQAICLEGCSEEHGECSRPNECSCRIGWQGRLCDECMTYPDCEHGYCETAWECTCHEGWGGLYCNQDLNYCTNNQPCLNGGTCTNTGEGSYTCTCPAGFTGANCEVEIDNCLTRPCQNGGVCKDVGNDYVCECSEGYTGPSCENSAARCEESPCANGATCEPIGSSFRCHCAEGWTGVNCQQEIDECRLVVEPCQNGGQCIDASNDYYCICPSGFSGDFCEINENDCAGENPCLNGGQCVDGSNRFVCRCRPGFMGDLCEIDIDDCLTRPCANGGSCKDKVNDFQCFCAPGYTGRMCNEQINGCNPNYCQNGASCSDLDNGFECSCAEGFEGNICQYRLGEAPSTPYSPELHSTQPTMDNPGATEREPVPSGRTGESREQPVPNSQVSFTQTQLILIICLASGVPMFLLFVLVTTLLCRRYRRKNATDRNLEAEQNAINGMNNRIHNPMMTNAEKGKADLYDYPTTEKKVLNDSDIPASVHQIPLHYRNSAATQPPTTKVENKDLIKDIYRANERQLLNKSNALVAPSTIQHGSTTEQQYIPYYQERHSNISNTTAQALQRPSWTSAHSTNNSNNVDSNGISTVCDTVLHSAPQMSDASGNCNYTSETTLQSSRHQNPSQQQHRRSSLAQVTNGNNNHHMTCDV